MSFNPGIELVMEAFEGYWRKVPSVKRLVFRSMPDETTRAAALKAGEVDIVYLLERPHRGGGQARRPGLRLAAADAAGVFCLDLLEQWDPKSPWHDRRVRLAASHALDRDGAQPGRDARPRASDRRASCRRDFDFALRIDAARLRPRAGQAAPRRGGLPQRLRRGRPHPVSAILLAGRGDRRAICRPSASARACAPWSAPPFLTAWREKKLRGVIMGLGAAGNAATRIEAYVTKGGIYAYGAVPGDRGPLPAPGAASWTGSSARRCCTRSSRSSRTRRWTRRSTSWPSSGASARGWRRPGAGLIQGFPYAAPCEDLKLK